MYHCINHFSLVKENYWNYWNKENHVKALNVWLLWFSMNALLNLLIWIHRSMIHTPFIQYLSWESWVNHWRLIITRCSYIKILSSKKYSVFIFRMSREVNSPTINPTEHQYSEDNVLLNTKSSPLPKVLSHQRRHEKLEKLYGAKDVFTSLMGRP